MKRTDFVIHKVAVLLSLAAMMFSLTFPLIFSGSICMDDCTCCCKKEMKPDIVSDCCNSVQAVTVSDNCCYNQHPHITHFYMPKNQSYKNIPCDLRTSILDNYFLFELYGIVHEDKLSPVRIIDIIFKPPIIQI